MDLTLASAQVSALKSSDKILMMKLVKEAPTPIQLSFFLSEITVLSLAYNTRLNDFVIPFGITDLKGLQKLKLTGCTQVRLNLKVSINEFRA